MFAFVPLFQNTITRFWTDPLAHLLRFFAFFDYNILWIWLIVLSSIPSRRAMVVKVLVEGVENNHNCYHIPKISPSSHCHLKIFAEILHFYKNLHSWLLIPFWFSNLWIVKWFLEDGLYYFMANLSANILKLIPYLFWVFEVNNMKGDLVTNIFPNDPLCYTYCHAVFFDFFCP